MIPLILRLIQPDLHQPLKQVYKMLQWRTFGNGNTGLIKVPDKVL